MTLSSYISITCLVVGLATGGYLAWKLKPVEVQVITQVKDRIVTKVEVVKPDGTVETQTSTTEPVYPPPPPPSPLAPPAKRDYSVTATHPIGPADATRIGVEVGRRIWENVWGVAGWQQDQGVHVGVRVEF